MLFDPKWQKPDPFKFEQKLDPFKLETLIAWLERQDPEAEYDYTSCYSCLLSQYFQEHGYPDAVMAKNHFMHKIPLVIPGLPPEAEMITTVVEGLPPYFNWIAEGRPRTFADALSRADLARTDPLAANMALMEILLPW